MAGRKWTPSEDEILKALFANTKTEDLANTLNRTYRAVAMRANLLEIGKSEEYMRKMLQNNSETLKLLGDTHRFKKGSQPVNKGKKITEWMAPEAIERIKVTQFKKGERPKTAPPPGTISVVKHKGTGQSHKFIGHKMVHRIEWEQKKGKIPAGSVLACKSTDTLNTDPDNWELITRAENMRRNTIHRYPKELKQTINILSKLKRKINEKQN